VISSFQDEGSPKCPNSRVATGKLPPPADRNVCPTSPNLRPGALRIAPRIRRRLLADRPLATSYGPRFQIHSRFVAGPIEHSTTSSVKASMDHLRTAICSLLPALWLLAAGDSPVGPWNGCADDCCRTSASLSADSGHAPLADARSFEQPARFVSRRTGTQTGWCGPLGPAVISASGLRIFEPDSSPPTVSTDADSLARCWQFHWHTALEPRAPSSVS
jgi:hypothetical protein